jgi:formylglycine-generating enzyme required for sulfatase activity
MKNIHLLYIALLLFSLSACKQEPGFIEKDIEMLLITGGTFTMGNDSEEGASGCITPNPTRSITLSSFYMGKYQITQAQYENIMGVNPSNNKGDNTGNHPVEQVSWYDAVEFCNALSELENRSPAYTIDKDNKDPNNENDTTADPKWTVTLNAGSNGYRLPTEAQWEYACRAGTSTLYNTGNTITKNEANIESTGTVAVGSFAPNNWGLYDMHGNVWEWCWDWVYLLGKSLNYYSEVPNPGIDPLGLDTGNRKAERGGSWRSQLIRVSSSYRERARPENAGFNDLGFRLVRPE